MRRSDQIEVSVEGPMRGLVTRIPEKLTAKQFTQAVVAGKNFRAEDGVLRNAPGVTRVVVNRAGLQSPVNFLGQANIISASKVNQSVPLLGTESKFYVIGRGSAELVCPASNAPTNLCTTTFAFTSETGYEGAGTQQVADLIAGWSPRAVILGGNVISASGVVMDGSEGYNRYERSVSHYFAKYLQAYRGVHGSGDPEVQRLFAAMGDNEFFDEVYTKFLDFFAQPNNDRYYDFKIGPCHFVVLSMNQTESDGTTIGSTQYLWAQSVLQASDCAWKILVANLPPYSSATGVLPGFADFAGWDFATLGVQLILCGGGAAVYEHLVTPDGVPVLCVGTGGAPLGTFGAVSPQSILRDNEAFGALKITATLGNLNAQYIDVTGYEVDALLLTNPADAGGLCYTNLAEWQVRELRIEQQTSGMEVGKKFRYTALAYYTNGSFKDVTEVCTWVSTDDTIAQIDRGTASGLAPGAVTISAEFEGFSDSVPLSVSLGCYDEAVELVLIVDVSDSTGSWAGNAPRLDQIRSAAKTLIDSLTPGQDYASLIACTGTYSPQASNCVLVQPLTANLTWVKDAIDTLSPGGSRPLGAAIRLAQDELTGVRHSSSRRRMVVAFIDGKPDTVVGNVPVDYADALSDADTDAAAAALAIKSLPSPPVLVVVNVGDLYVGAQTWASWLFTPATIFDAQYSMATINRFWCNYGFDFSQGLPPAVGPVPNYSDFINWDVTLGQVDLAGMAGMQVLQNYYPGNGQYVGLCGSAGFGELTSKVAFTFTSGKTYRLNFRMAGNYVQPIRNQVQVSVGDFLDQIVTIEAADYQSDFVDYSFTFTAPSTATAKIQFHVIPQASQWSAAGPYLGFVELLNVTDVATMLSDDFDAEHI